MPTVAPVDYVAVTHTAGDVVDGQVLRDRPQNIEMGPILTCA
jgi:hypothetical protein